MREVLAELQWRSFRANREFCGIMGLTEDGEIVISRPRRGRVDSCRPRDPWRADHLIASFHTHGAFDPDSDAELPSVDDVLADMNEGVDGWVATPGGRLWFIDGLTGVIRQICGLGCLPQDPDFIPGYMGPIPQRMTLAELERFFAVE